MTSEDDDKLHKSRRRSRKHRNNGRSFSLPSSFVCTPAEAASQPGAVEFGVLIIVIVFLLYFYGCYETIMSLPDVPSLPNFRAHMGENLNLALNDFDSSLKRRRKRRKTKEKLTKDGPSTVKRTENIQVPTAKWPISLREESQDTYETLIHPGDKSTEMRVPKFWSLPVHNNGLMTRETAMKIGSCTQPDEKGNFARGDSCPTHQRTIFISIASYRDFQCRQTLEEAFLMATHPDRIRVAVVDQIVNGEDPRCDEPQKPCDQDPNQALCKYKDQVDVYEMDAQLSIGPVFARHIGYRMYRGEYYATQSDAHVSFTKGWDMDIISQLEATRNEMGVLSTYLTDVQGSIDENGNSKRKTRPIMCNTKWEGGAQGLHLRHGAQPEAFPSVHGEPQLSPWWAAGYSFSRGHFVVNVPYDWLQPMIFQGEEMSIGIRGFTIGYDYYAPERSVCFHHYAVGKNAKIRNKVHHFWENDNKYAGTGRIAMMRLLGLVHMNPEVDKSSWDHTDEHIYGVGGVRSPERFYELYGIDVHKKTAEDHLCKFVDVGAKMHHLFTPQMRPDGMGIDYSKIDFKFVDPLKPHPEPPKAQKQEEKQDMKAVEIDRAEMEEGGEEEFDDQGDEGDDQEEEAF